MWVSGNRWTGLTVGCCMACIVSSASLHAASVAGRWRLEVQTLHWSQHQRVTLYDSAGNVVDWMEEDIVDDPAGLLREQTWGYVAQTDAKIKGSFIRSTFCSGEAPTTVTGSISEDNRVVFTGLFRGRSENCVAMGVPFHVEYSNMVESFEGLYDPEKKTVTGTFKAFQDRKYTVVQHGDEDWGYAYYSVNDTDITRTGTFSIEVLPKEFMLTFDDGPVPENTENILEALRNIKVDGKPVVAGFFMLGDECHWQLWGAKCQPLPFDVFLFPAKGHVKGNEELVRRVAEDHHFIGVHTQHHPWFDDEDCSVDYVEEEISGCYEAIRKALNPKDPDAVSLKKIFRPPYFRNTPNVRDVVHKLGFQMVLGAGENEGSAVDVGGKECSTARDLMKAWDKPYPCVLTFHDHLHKTAESIVEAIECLQKDGFTLVNFDPDRVSQPESGGEASHMLSGIAHCPVDLAVTGPDGLVLGKERNETPDGIYAEFDEDGDGDLDDFFFVPDARPGEYLISVIPDPNALPEDRYSLEVSADDGVVVLAEQVAVRDIPAEPYSVRVGRESDVNGDGTVDFEDFALFASRWLNEDCLPGTGRCGGADFDATGRVDAGDLIFFADEWLAGAR